MGLAWNTTRAFSHLLIWSYIFQKTDSERKGCMPLCFWTIVSVTQPLKRQSSSITEQMEAQRSLNDSRADVQYRKNKGHEWHFIVHQCVSAKALMLQWAGGLWLRRKKVWVKRKLTSSNVLRNKRWGEKLRVQQMPRKTIVQFCIVRMNPFIPPGTSLVPSPTWLHTPPVSVSEVERRACHFVDLLRLRLFRNLSLIFVPLLCVSRPWFIFPAQVVLFRKLKICSVQLHTAYVKNRLIDF